MHATDVDVESRHRVRSADDVVLEIPVAGPTSRILAYAVDAVLILVVEILVVAVAFFLGSITIGGIAEVLRGLVDATGESGDGGLGLAGVVILVLLLQLVTEVAYYVTWEVLAGGRSPGKMLLGLRVVRDGGLPLTAWASIVRNVLRAVDQLPVGYVTGLIAIILSPEARRLGDVAAGTLVMRLEHTTAPEAVPPMDPQRTAAVRLTAAQITRLDLDAARLARATLRRLRTLDADQRVHVLATAVDALARRLEADPPEDPEAFLHAVVDAFDAHRR